MNGHQEDGQQSFYAPLQAQDSILLDMPAEVRLHIYDAILADPTTVKVCYRSKRRMERVEHPLLWTCRQIREEIFTAWTERAPEQASTVVCAIRNFEIGDTGGIREMLAALPSLDDGSHRTFIMTFHVENHFERSVRKKHRQQHQMSEAAKQVTFFTNVSFDYGTLDIGHIERVMHSKLVPKNVLDAFLEAKGRYKTQRAEQRRQRLQAEVEGFDLGAVDWH